MPGIQLCDVTANDLDLYLFTMFCGGGGGVAFVADRQGSHIINLRALKIYIYKQVCAIWLDLFSCIS